MLACRDVIYKVYIRTRLPYNNFIMINWFIKLQLRNQQAWDTTHMYREYIFSNSLIIHEKHSKEINI